MNTCFQSRRQLLRQMGGGLGSVALAWLLRERDVAAATSRRTDSGTRRPHHAPKAKRVVQLFMSGAASQVDTFDYKPELVKRNGQPFDPGGKVELFQSQAGSVFASPWKFRPHGACGKHISDLLPNLASCVDDIAFIHSMVSKSNVHGPATFLQSTGFVQPGFPSAGAWVSYALGRETDNLPAFVVLPDSRGFPPNGPKNWSAGFLPAEFQATMIRAGTANPIYGLFPPKDSYVTPAAERDGRALLRRLNEQHRAEREGDSRLEARIAAYEMAARLQLSAPEVLDLSGESKATRQLYGLDREVSANLGRRCLLARRLLERGVRFVQVWSGADNGFPRRNWDSHEDLKRDHEVLGTELDQAASALLEDLKARGLLDETIVMWTTEFGRMPCSQGSKGRDHNPFTFTTWLAGGGIRGGVTYGESDEWSYKAAVNPTTGHDVHATVLHLLGLDHEKLTYRHNGLDRRLTDVEGHVIGEILA